MDLVWLGLVSFFFCLLLKFEVEVLVLDKRRFVFAFSWILIDFYFVGGEGGEGEFRTGPGGFLEGFLEGFWKDFGRILEGFWKDFGRISEGIGDDWENVWGDLFWRSFSRFLENFWGIFGELLEYFWGIY